MNDTMGIDISKDTPDAYWLSKREHKQFSNTKIGLSALVRWIRQKKALLIVFEATGVYHRLLETGLAAHNIPFVRVNPRQARRFCEGTGQLAKTDRVDAAMLAKMGALLELEADQPKSETLHDLKQLATARLAFLLMHINMHCQTMDQGPNCSKSTAGRDDIQPTFQADQTPFETDRT